MATARAPKPATRRTGVREAAAQATRDSILRAATKVFAKYGYDGGSVEKISKAANSYDRMIYYYFGSKEGLFIAVLEEHLPPHGRCRGRARPRCEPAGGSAHGGDPLRARLLPQEPRVRDAAEHREPAQGPAHREVAARARVLVEGDRDHPGAAGERRGAGPVPQGRGGARPLSADRLHRLFLHLEPPHADRLPRRAAGDAGGGRALGGLRDRDRAAHGRRGALRRRSTPSPAPHEDKTWQKSQAPQSRARSSSGT